ncbi:MAG TPA: SDR family oxidoreductase, partial [Anaerolineales bacterium]|nr:SDR family oxidoreductase [Anaerolineales bacterium]
GKVILITGAGKGRGRILAQAFAEAGALVAANDISPINLDSLVSNGNKRITAFVEDVAKKVGAQNLIKQVEDEFGRIDVLINHAAVEPRASLLDMDEWDWHRVLDVNLTGAFLMIQSTGRVMRSQGSGAIVNLISGSSRDEGNEAAFAASMKALEALSHRAALELNPHGIRVYAVDEAGDTIVETVFSLLEEK